VRPSDCDRASERGRRDEQTNERRNERFGALGCISKPFRWPSRAVAVEEPQPINLNPRHPFCNSREPRWESEIRARSKKTDNGRGARNDFLLSGAANQLTVAKGQLIQRPMDPVR